MIFWGAQEKNIKRLLVTLPVEAISKIGYF
jgi:hypothetical protein